MSAPLRIAVLGAGGRGSEAYGSWLLAHPERASVVAVADPHASRRAFFASAGNVPAEYEDWRALVADAASLRLDAAIVALPDRMHVDPAIALVERGVPLLLEKPAASTPEELERLAAAVTGAGVPVALGHVLRFTPFWRTIAALLSSGAVGRPLAIDLQENIGFWHFAHSYVRGNWKRAADSSPMVLAKTCHDLDIIRWLAGEAPTSISSVGTLSHFTSANAPAGSPRFCVEGCPVAADCPFYAPRYYVDALRDVHGMPVTLLGPDTTPEGRIAALAVSDYGRCVYHSDNDVADHQQTSMAFASGLTATLTASAFTGENTRKVNISCSGGQIVGHMGRGLVEVDLFSPTAQLPELPTAAIESESARPPMGHRSITLSVRAEGEDGGDHRGHAGGDVGLISAFVSALETGRWSEELSFDAAMDSHRMAFAAERSRLSASTETASR